MKKLLLSMMLLSICCVGYVVAEEAEKPLGATAEDYDWWRDAKFGVFIHWGPSSILELRGGR